MGIENKIPFAIRLDTGEMVAVDEVPGGLGCGCKCPSCDGRLVARKGPINVHHFGHHDKSKEGCQYAFETSVRLMLLAKLDEIVVLNTPARVVRFEGTFHRVSGSHANIKVTRIAQVNRHAAPTATYSLVERPEYALSLYLPAVNEPRDPLPDWLDGYTKAHPKAGILVVNYSAFATHIFSDKRPTKMDTTTWLFNILSVESDCLSWMYHPSDTRVLIELQQQSDEQKRLEAIARTKEKDLVLARLKRQAELDELQRKRHEELLRQAQQLDARSARRRESIGPRTPLKQSSLLFCAYCYQQAAELSPEGYCYRDACRRKRLRCTTSAPARPVTVGELRRLFKQDTPSVPKTILNEFGEMLCPYCDTPMHKPAGSWWCEGCGHTFEAKPDDAPRK
ncbi:hypothetical protein D3C80_1095830 [compost metagenome]